MPFLSVVSVALSPLFIPRFLGRLITTRLLVVIRKGRSNAASIIASKTEGAGRRTSLQKVFKNVLRNVLLIQVFFWMVPMTFIFALLLNILQTGSDFGLDILWGFLMWLGVFLLTFGMYWCWSLDGTTNTNARSSGKSSCKCSFKSIIWAINPIRLGLMWPAYLVLYVYSRTYLKEIALAACGSRFIKWERALWASMYGKFDSPYYVWKSFEKYLRDELRVEETAFNQLVARNEEAQASQEANSFFAERLTEAREDNGAGSKEYQRILDARNGNVPCLLVVTSGPHTGKKKNTKLGDWYKSKECVTIGTDVDCNFCLSLDDSITENHCEINRAGSIWYAVSIDASRVEIVKQGNIVGDGGNTVTYSYTRINDGDTLVLGESCIRFSLQLGLDKVKEKPPNFTLDLCKQMLQQLSDLDITSSDILMAACNQGQYESVRFLLQRNDIDVNYIDKEQAMTPLSMAIVMPECLCRDCGEGLIQKSWQETSNCNCFEPESTFKYSFVIPAGVQPGTKMLVTVPGHGSDPYQVICTEEHKAGQANLCVFEKGQKSVIAEREAHSAVNMPRYQCAAGCDYGICECCLFARHSNYVQIVRALLKMKEIDVMLVTAPPSLDQITEIDNQGKQDEGDMVPPLVLAATMRFRCPAMSDDVERELMSLLLDHPGVDVNQPEEKHGNTPLHIAACTSEVCTQLLLQHPNIEMNKKNNVTGARTALYQASLYAFATKDLPNSRFRASARNMTLLMEAGALSEGQLFQPQTSKGDGDSKEDDGTYQHGDTCRDCESRLIKKKTEEEDSDVCNMCGTMLAAGVRVYECSKCEFSVCSKCKVTYQSIDSSNSDTTNCISKRIRARRCGLRTSCTLVAQPESTRVLGPHHNIC